MNDFTQLARWLHYPCAATQNEHNVGVLGCEGFAGNIGLVDWGLVQDKQAPDLGLGPKFVATTPAALRECHPAIFKNHSRMLAEPQQIEQPITYKLERSSKEVTP